VKEISGTAVSPLRYTYGTWAASGQAGEWTQEIKVGDANAETEWTKTYTDFAGRTVQQEFPAASGTVAATMAYNALGQLARQTEVEDPASGNGVQTLFAYNSEGDPEFTVLDWDRDDVIDHAGLDRINQTTTDVYSRSGTTVRRTTARVWHADNTDASTLVSTTEQDGYGNRSWRTDAAGAVTSTTVARTTPGAWTVTATAPDDSQQVQTYTGGRLASSATYTSTSVLNLQTTYAYDAHGRLSSQTDARTGPVAFTYTNRDEVLTATVNNGTETTTNTYDALGNLLTLTRPDSSVTTNEYHLRNNQLKKTSGGQTYPVEYAYDLHGRMRTMTTWQNATSSTGAALTTW
jgi:YD repeat-containing protein